jgi:PiT family inorganic phosphate transporter
MAGGWRIVKTIGSPNHPTSETHRRLLSRDGGGDYDRFGNACKGSYLHNSCDRRSSLRVGATRGWHAVRWIRGEKIVVARVVTFPGAALIGAAGYAFAQFAIQPFIR